MCVVFKLYVHVLLLKISSLIIKCYRFSVFLGILKPLQRITYAVLFELLKTIFKSTNVLLINMPLSSSELQF